MIEMATKVKLQSLTVDCLNKLLKSQHVEVKGNKSVKVGKLTEIYGADEIDQDELGVEGQANDKVQDALTEIRTMMNGLTAAFTEMAKSQKILCDTMSRTDITAQNNISATGGAAHIATAAEEEESDVGTPPPPVPRQWSARALQELTAT